MPNPFAFQYDLLFVQAGVVNDLESVRIANENRLRQLTRTETDADGLERGFGLPETMPEVQTIRAIVDGLRAVEADAVKNLEKAVRTLPIGRYIKDTPGLGLKQTARLLAATGDPYWHTAEDRPRLVSELWSYSGYAVINGEAPKRRKGQLVTWSPDARMRAFLVAQSCVKALTSPFRASYDEARGKYEDVTHTTECVRCGPSGKPALPGSPLSNGHKHARALRAVSKEVLRRLWVASKEAHEDWNTKAIAA